MSKLEQNRMYWADTFADCIVTKKEKNAPPERYFIALKGNRDGVYIDTFALDDELRIDFAWNEEQKAYWNELLYAHFKKHNVSNWQTAKLIRRVYPPKIFDELLEDE